jgi:hypothetical protein
LASLIEILIPAPRQIFLIELDHPLNAAQFLSAKASIPLQSNRIQPELGLTIVALDMDVRRLGSIAGIEEKTVWTMSHDRGHARQVRRCLAKCQASRLDTLSPS